MIGIVSPESATPFAEAIREVLRAKGFDSWLGHGFDHPNWGETEVAVDVTIPCGDQEMARAPRLRGVVSPLLGYDFIDLAAATRRSVAVANCEVSENRESMAEATIMLILALLYRLTEAQAALANPSTGSPLRYGRMLKGKTVGIVGAGGIAQALIHRLGAWGCHLLVHTRAGSAPPTTTPSTLEELMRVSDVVVVATRLSNDTRHLLSRDLLALMKDDAILVNTARGPIIDEAALIEVLEAGRIAGAALDVFDVEPLPGDSPLRRLNNVILTPHAVGHTIDGARAVPIRVVEHVLDLTAGRLPISCKNLGIANTWPPHVYCTEN